METHLSPDNYVSQIFLVEKKDGGQRPVINLKGLNQFMKMEYFKMEGLHLLPVLLQQGDWMAKMDLKDAYLQVPIHPDHQSFLTFQWEQKWYKFTCLPFGLSSAPRVFTKLMKSVVGFLRQVGCRLIICLDDLLILHQDRVQLEQIIPSICQLFDSLGLIVNHKKSILEPTQKLEFLGFEILSQSMLLSIPQEKMRKIQQDARRLLAQTSVSVREISQFVGKATATMRALPLAPLHYRALQSLMNSVHLTNHTQRGEWEVRYCSTAEPIKQSRSVLVAIHGQEVRVKPHCTNSPICDYRVRCIQQGLGCSTEWSDLNRRCLVSRGEETSHQLPGTAGSISSSPSIREELDECNNSSPFGQCSGSNIHQPERRHYLHPLVPISNHSVDLVHVQEPHTHCRTPPGSPQYDSRPGVLVSSRPLRLDAEPKHVSENKGEAWAPGGGLICLSPDQACFTAGEQTQKQQQQMPLCRIGLNGSVMPTHLDA